VPRVAKHGKSFADECSIAAAKLTHFAGRYLGLAAEINKIGALDFAPAAQDQIIAHLDQLVVAADSSGIDAAIEGLQTVSDAMRERPNGR
jgi:hypothetical protein